MQMSFCDSDLALIILGTPMAAIIPINETTIMISNSVKPDLRQTLIFISISCSCSLHWPYPPSSGTRPDSAIASSCHSCVKDARNGLSLQFRAVLELDQGFHRGAEGGRRPKFEGKARTLEWLPSSPFPAFPVFRGPTLPKCRFL